MNTIWKEIIGFQPFDEEIFIHVFSKILNIEEINENENNIELTKKWEFERLEFLGDSLLNTIITEKIFNDYPKAQPGPLTKLRSRMVRNETLHDIVKKLKIFEKFSKDSEVNQISLQNNFDSVKTKADFFECLIGTIYEDQGWFFTKNWVNSIYKKFEIQKLNLKDNNYIDILQMVTRSNLPTFYSIVNPLEKKTKISCSYNNKEYFSEGYHKPHIKQNVCLKILQDLILEKVISESIFDFKYE